MKISTSALAGALTADALTFGATASDASITFGIKASTLTDGSTQTFAPETVFGTDFGVATSSGGFTVILPPPGSTSGQFKSPWNGGPDTDYEKQETATYFSVGGALGSPQSVTFASAVSGLTILLGSIDTYNSFKFEDTNAMTAHTVTGLMIAQALGLTLADADANGNFEESAVIRFQGPFNKMTVTSTQAAAEFAVAAVPLPAAGLLLLAGLGGLVASRKLRRGAVA
jgi:hypothetical protein